MLEGELLRLMKHMEWADAETWEAVLAATKAQTDTSVRELLYHIHSVHWGYLQIWRGDAFKLAEASTFADLHAVYNWCNEYYQQVGPFLSGLDPELLRREVAFPWAEHLAQRFDEVRPVTFAETILQVTSHTTYHRGQVNRRLRELGGEPKPTDFVTWIWMGSPETKWEKSG